MAQPWFEDASSGVGLHALVIGVSAYPHHPRGVEDLSSAATSALMFATWLRDEYPRSAPGDAPLRSIRLLISPVGTEDTASFAGAEAADCASVAVAVVDWSTACRSDNRNVALLFACGHGFQQSKEDGLVVLSDAIAADAERMEALDVGRVRDGLNDGPDRQWFFIDACRFPLVNGEKGEHVVGSVGLEKSPGVGPRHCPVLFSAAPGKEAFSESSGSLFTQGLLQCLRLDAIDRFMPNEPWSVTAESLKQTVRRTTNALANDRVAVQEPVLSGTVGDNPLLVWRDAPRVPYTIKLKPQDAEPHASVRLFDGLAARDVLAECRFPVNEVPTEAGLWNLYLRFRPGPPVYKDVESAVDVRPRARLHEVEVR